MDTAVLQLLTETMRADPSHPLARARATLGTLFVSIAQDAVETRSVEHPVRSSNPDAALAARAEIVAAAILDVIRYADAVRFYCAVSQLQPIKLQLERN
jgi:hypothetical protein